MGCSVRKLRFGHERHALRACALERIGSAQRLLPGRRREQHRNQPPMLVKRRDETACKADGTLFTGITGVTGYANQGPGCDQAGRGRV